MPFTSVSLPNPASPPKSACRIDQCSIHDFYFIVVADTHRACTLLSIGLRPPLACCCSGGRHARAIAGVKVHQLLEGVIFLAKTSSVHHERSSYPIICMHGVGETGPLSQGSRSVVCPFPSGLPMSHRAGYSALGRESQLLQAFLTGYSHLALRIYPGPPLGSVD